MRRSALCCTLVLMVLDGCAAMPQRQVQEGALQPQTLIYVARRGWHIDVGFNVSDLGTPLGAVAAAFPSAQYVFFGFGDRRYLFSQHKNFPSLLTALWPGAGLVLATALGGAPEDAFGPVNVVRVSVSPTQAQEARAFIWNSLIKTDGTVRFYAQGPYEGSLYYSAIPTYSALHTCNTFAAETLRAAGLPVQSAGVVFAAQLWMQVRRIDAAVRKSSVPVTHAALSDRSRNSWPLTATRIRSTPRA